MTIDLIGKCSVEVPTVNGRFHGCLISDDKLERFRNIKYGSIPSRFSLPEEFIYENNNEQDLTNVDCIKQGPICPQPTPYEDSLIGIPKQLVRPFELVYDEFECLNLMIIRPKGITVNDKLPVVVWIHGGGNIAGTPYRTVCDPSDWVLKSVKIGKPIIFVSLQFRVHLFGSLPYNGIGNFILHDQRLGIEWVYNNIKYFGGDESEISLIGQSAGSCCVSAQSCAKGADKLIKRIALMSGSISSMPFMTLKEYESKGQQLANSIQAKVEDFINLPWEKLVEAGIKCNFNVAFPVDDGKFLDFGEFGKPHSLIKSMIISDCIEDGYFFTDYMTRDVNELYKKLTKIGIDEESSQRLLDAYEIIDDDKLIHGKLGDLITDAFFCFGNELMDSEMRKQSDVKIYRQFFDVVNPFDPNFGNNHMVEVIYLFNAYIVSADFEHITRYFQRKWIEFFYGQDPWDTNSIVLASHKEKDTIKLISLDEKYKYRRIHLFPLLSKLNKRLMHTLTNDGWGDEEIGGQL